VNESEQSAQQIVLVGLSGVGKSTVGRLIAGRLGWSFIDTDDAITQAEGRTPAQIITGEGEAAFRAIEERQVLEAAGRTPAVIATGGGAFLNARLRRALSERGYTCFLDAPPVEIARRIRSAPDAEARPLLGEDLETRLQELDAERRPFYTHADAWVPTLGVTPDETAARVLRAWAEGAPEALRGARRLDRLGAGEPAKGPAAVVDTGTERYPIWVGAGELERLAERFEQLGLDGRVFLIADQNVMDAHGASVARTLDAAGVAGASYVIPPGEQSKTHGVAREIYAWLAQEKAERRDVIVALGGGVVCDLAGYVAATYLRGLPLVHVPTSLLAMNDAAIGGKVAVDLPGGKNLVGAFYQPRAVISDVSTLMTMPRQSYVEGFAEVIKHALILDPPMLDLLHRHAAELTAGQPNAEQLAAVVSRSSRLKAMVVSSDPTERGQRAILNYGHTIGHGIEAAAQFTGYLHGEAVSVGMMGAARIANRMGLIDEELIDRHADVLRAYGLPLKAPNVDAASVLEAMKRDKKVEQGKQRFILLEGIGRPVVRDDVPADLVREIVGNLVRD
jgi:3-dehydroquinate synthase